MNELQEAIFEVLKSIFKNNNLLNRFQKHEEYRGQKIIENSAIRYGILNYVAKYSLANDEYFITEKCFKYLNQLNFFSEKGLLRSKKGTKFKWINKDFDFPLSLENCLMASKYGKLSISPTVPPISQITKSSLETSFLINS